jgi:SAM-dependent methyltransferase
MTTTVTPPHAFAPNGPEIYAAFNTMLALETRWVPSVSGAGRAGSHPYVPYPLGRFMLGMRAAKMYFIPFDHERAEPRRFLDVGCGTGTKSMLAAQMNWYADGLDFVPEYVAAARELMNTQVESKVYEADAMKFDRYGDYDVCYMYRPLVSDESMAALVSVVCDQIRDGSILFIPTYDPTDERLEKYEEDLGLWVVRK